MVCYCPVIDCLVLYFDFANVDFVGVDDHRAGAHLVDAGARHAHAGAHRAGARPDGGRSADDVDSHRSGDRLDDDH